MAWSDYWGALSARQRTGFATGAAVIVVASIALAFWLLRDPFVPLAAGLDSARLSELERNLDAAKVGYRIAASGDALAVRGSQLGKARAAAAAGAFELPPSVGLELFKETDFSSTDFAQRINYQRALQGELTRTLQTIAGVRTARVHVILPDGGLFKRVTAKATAAVTVSMQAGRVLTHAQMLGIQRLVAASVPEIKLDDVVVLEDSGALLSRASGLEEGEVSSAQLDLKRQADQYFEHKLIHLLQSLLSQGSASLSVDTTLDERQSRVTTEEPLGAHAARDSGHAAGVLIKERQSQRGQAPGLLQTDGYAAAGDSTDWEYEYKVGNRIEQTLSTPGSIKRISVAVAVQGGPTELTGAAVEELVAHAVGIDRARGDSVAVLILPAVPAAQHDQAAQPQIQADVPAVPSTDKAPVVTREGFTLRNESALAVGLAVAALIAAAFGWARACVARRSAGGVDEHAILAKVQQWLVEGQPDGR